MKREKNWLMNAIKYDKTKFYLDRSTASASELPNKTAYRIFFVCQISTLKTRFTEYQPKSLLHVVHRKIHPLLPPLFYVYVTCNIERIK